MYRDIDRAKEYIGEEPLRFADFTLAMQLGAEILYAGAEGLLVYNSAGGCYQMSARTREAAGQMLELIPATELFVAHEDWYIGEIRERFSLADGNRCVQAVYGGASPPPEDGRIRRLGPGDLPTVQRYYRTISDGEYIASRLAAGMYGIDIDGALAGFVGAHDEGTVGLLTVLPEYRRRGLGRALMSYMIGERLKAGLLPVAHIYDDNAASIALNRGAGMSIAEGRIYWLF